MVLEYVHDSGPKRLERLPWMDDAGSIAVLIDLTSKKNRLRTMECGFLEQELESGVAHEIDDPYLYLYFPDSAYSAARLRERDGNAEALHPLLSAAPELQFDRTKRGQLIAMIVSRDPADPLYRNKRYVYELWWRFCRRGQIRNALLSDRHNGGWSREKRETNPSSLKQGRPQLGEGPDRRTRGFVITRESAETLYQIGRLFWKTRNENGQKRTWTQDLQLGYEKFFATGHRVIDGVRMPVLPPKSELPTVHQLKHEYFRREGIAASVRQRLGERKFNLKYRPLHGDQRDIARAPMDLVQMDAALAKIYLVHPVRREVIDRPTLVMARDTMSRLITGFSVSWEHESALCYLLAFENMARDKVEYCRKLGIDIKPEQWPCCHVPSGLLVDNGPGITERFSALRSALNLRVDNPGAGRPDLKPIIESGFKDINDNLIFKLPGAVPVEAADPDADPSVKRGARDAKLDIREFEQAIVYYILDYNPRVLKDYPLADEMKGVVIPVPVRLWEWGIRNCSGSLREVHIDLVRLHCLPKAQARVTRKGIMLHGKTYQCRQALTEEWQTQVSARGEWQVEVVYDPRNLEKIYLRRDLPPRRVDDPYVEECWRIRAEGESASISLGDLRYERLAFLRDSSALLEERPQQIAEFNARLRTVAANATQKTTVAMGRRKQMTGNRRARRKAAIGEERAGAQLFDSLRRKQTEEPLLSLNETPEESLCETEADYQTILTNLRGGRAIE